MRRPLYNYEEHNFFYYFVRGVYVSQVTVTVTLFERFSIECRKTKTKVITLASHKGDRQSSEPIETRSNYK